MSVCVILGACPIRDYEFAARELRRALPEVQSEVLVVACDGGLRHLQPLGLEADLVVGDFDSHPRPDTQVPVIALPREKDDTDTVYALKTCLERGGRRFIMLGVVGGRLDHTLGNLAALNFLWSAGAPAQIIDDYSVMQLVGTSPVQISGRYEYFSLLNLDGSARGFHITGAKYPLDGEEIGTDYQYGISNEVLPGGSARVWLEGGKALLVKVLRDRSE